MEPSQPSLAGAARPERVGRALASPAGVLVLVPLLVIAAGVTVLWLGRTATRDASDTMARRQLAAQATDVQHDVAFALDQADPLLASHGAERGPIAIRYSAECRYQPAAVTWLDGLEHAVGRGGREAAAP